MTTRAAKKPLSVVILALLLLSACRYPDDPPPEAGKTRYYCVHNGYSSWQPVCRDFREAQFSVATDCVVGDQIIRVIHNPTNVTECYQ